MINKTIIINNSIGGIINDNDLIEYYNYHYISGFGLDVFEIDTL